MNSNYLKARDIIKRAMSDIQNLYDNAPTTGMENNAAYNSLENLYYEMERAADTIEHYSKPAHEGKLQELSSGKFELDGHVLSCGNSLEVYDQEEGWVPGRVEARKQGEYYFYSSDLGHPSLYTGMKARIRE